MKNNFSNIFVKKNFKRLYDIVWYESPLTTLYYNIFDNKYYLFDWSSYTATHNTWTVIEIELNNLYKFVTNDISFLELYHLSSNIGASCEISSNLDYVFEETLIDTIDDVYLPPPDDIFNKIDCPKYDELIEFLKENK